jgi:hypothetical protein
MTKTEYIPSTSDKAADVAIEVEAAARAIVEQVMRFDLSSPCGNIKTKRITIKYFPSNNARSDSRGVITANAEFSLNLWINRRVGNAVKSLEQI